MTCSLIIYTAHWMWLCLYITTRGGQIMFDSRQIGNQNKATRWPGKGTPYHTAPSQCHLSLYRRSRDSWWITQYSPGLTSSRNTGSICHTISQFFMCINIFVSFLLREALFYCLQTSLSEFLLLSAMLCKSFAWYLDWWWTLQRT